jgi:hypothetical protein
VLGLFCLVSAFWGFGSDDGGDFAATLVARFLQPLLVLLIGFVIHQCWLHTGYTPPHLWGRV